MRRGVWRTPGRDRLRMGRPNIWPEESWSGTSLWPDGTVPRQPEAPWLKYKVWRGQPEYLISGRDLQMTLLDSCVSSCVDGVGVVELAFQLENLGPQVARPDTPLSAWTLDDAGQPVLAGTWTASRELLPQETAGPFTLSLDLETARRGVTIAAGDPGDGAVPRDDCDPTNNALTWTPDACP